MTDWSGRIKFFVSSSDPDAAPTWVDLTSRVRDHVAVPELFNGRANDLDQTEPGALQLLLDNRDGALTFGNTSSPYASWWGPGRRCYVTERVTSAVTQDRYTGFIQMPQEAVATADLEQWVVITAIDRLGRLSQGRPFVSTLGAHIMGSARNGALVSYWPLNDPAAPFAAAVGPNPAAVTILQSTVSNAEQLPAALPAEGPAVTADDVPSVKLVAGLNSGAIASSPAILATPTATTIGAAQAVTVVGWFHLDSIDTSALAGFVMALLVNGGQVLLNVLPVTDSRGVHWREVYFDGALYNVDASDGSGSATGRWYIVGMQWRRTPNALELWVDDQQATGTYAGVVTSASVYQDSDLTMIAYGSVAHLQVYVGNAADFTFADFTAQRAVGLSGLEAQTTGARVTSILGYAGVPSGEYSGAINTGTSAMQRASLAGKDPLTALREAETTEQGLLYVDGSGLLHFLDRRSLYGI